jgi:hypothetical protein
VRAMKYRLWDTDINRLFGTFESEGEALALVRTLVGRYGDAYADDLAMGCERSDGSFIPPLTGAALIARAGQIVAKPKTAVQRSGPVVDSEAKKTNAEASANNPRAGAGQLADQSAKHAGDVRNAVYQKSKIARRKSG